MSKTVVVLGAGFSEKADIPVQENIMDSIPHNIKQKEYYVDVAEFYSSIFNISSPRDFSRVPLEDVFTFFDRAITAGEDSL